LEKEIDFLYFFLFDKLQDLEEVLQGDNLCLLDFVDVDSDVSQ
jgi:hypothetical protein